MSISRALQYAVFFYHKHNEDGSATASHFTQMYQRNFRRQHLLPDFLSQIDEYAVEFHSLEGHRVIQSPVRVGVTIGSDLLLSGEVPRIDLTPDGVYAAWLLLRSPRDWEAELRMPILQGHFAEYFGVSRTLVTVGAYTFDIGRHESTQYGDEEIDAAYSEARQLGVTLSA